MLSLPPSVRIYLCRIPADMRRSFDGLAALTQTVVGQAPPLGTPLRVPQLPGRSPQGAAVGRSQRDEKAAFLEEVRLELRQQRSVKILRQFHDWLEEQAPKALPKTPIGRAIGYARSNWTALERYAAHGSPIEAESTPT